MIDKLNEEIQHNAAILLGCTENDTPFTLEELWRFNIKMIEDLNNKLKPKTK